MENDFIVGFTIFNKKGFKTMYRHFNSLEHAKLFASNVNIKDNCKIYVDLDYFEKLLEKCKKYESDLHDLKSSLGYTQKYIETGNHIPRID